MRPPADYRLLSLAQLAPYGAWQLELAHDRDTHLLIWTTRGQGRALLDGVRRGVGVHNAVFVPAGHLFALEMGRQGFGQALSIAPGTDVPLPTRTTQLRVRGVSAQKELTALLEATAREQSTARAASEAAMGAYATLVAIWLHRQMPGSPEAASPTKGQKLMREFCDRIVADHETGAALTHYARALGVTPTHLSRVARAQSGLSAAALLAQRKVHAARSRLIETEEPISRIASRLGFGSAAYFSRFVQRHTGLSPTALRRAARQ